MVPYLYPPVSWEGSRSARLPQQESEANPCQSVLSARAQRPLWLAMHCLHCCSANAQLPRQLHSLQALVTAQLLLCLPGPRRSASKGVPGREAV